MSTEELNLPDDVHQLKMMIAARDDAISQHTAMISLHARTISQHTATIAEQHEVIVQRETVIAAQHNTIAKQLQNVENLQHQLARLLRKQYGRQKERIDPDQLTLFSAKELEELAKELDQGPSDDSADGDATDDDAANGDSPNDDSGNGGSGNGKSSSKKPKRKGHGRRPLPEHLPRKEVVHKLTDEQRICPCCGKLRKEIGNESSEQLDFIPATLKVIKHVRLKYACGECEENVSIAARPPQPINKGLPGPGLLAQTILSKYGDYSTLYRQEDILSRSQVIIRRSTLCGWVAAMADLLKPLYEQMCNRVRRSKVINTDDTGIKMLERGGCRNCKFWTYIGDEWNPYVVYEFSLTREGKEPQKFLEGFAGYLQADAYSGYNQVYANNKIREVACMAHCRRYWWEAIDTDSRRAHEAISYIGRLYELEVRFEKSQLVGDVLRDARQKYAVPILKTFEAWLESQRGKVLPKSLIGKAFTYTFNQWQALCRYTEDGALGIDNNLAERMVKLPAIGRKNWLFVGSQTGGDRAAILLSLVASAKYCGVEPWAWLNHVIREIPIRQAGCAPEKPPDLTDLLPDDWLKSHPHHRWQIDEIRQEERKRSRAQKIAKRRQK
jgi:transposase